MRKKDLTGQTFGKLTVIREDSDKHEKNTYWICKCECGNTKSIVGFSLTSGRSTSCGCVNIERIAKLNKKGNKFDLSGEYGVCYFNDDKGSFIFDKEDFDKIKDFCWYKSNSGYAIHDKKNQKSLLAHRLIMNCPEKLVVDHINHDTLDNRKCNLRVCKQNENLRNQKLNSRNTSGVKGVSFYPKINKWGAKIYLNGKGYNLGFFSDINDAAKARCKAEKEMYGEYAYIKQ